MSTNLQWPKAERARPPLADDASMQAILAGPAANAPRINLFRAFGNALSLAPDFMRYFMHLFEPLELDARIERLVVLLVGRESDCEYVWRQKRGCGQKPWCLGGTDRCNLRRHTRCPHSPQSKERPSSLQKRLLLKLT